DPGGSGFCVYSNSNMFTPGGAYVRVEGSGASTVDVVVHPLVNIYCGGSLKATYGQTPNQVAGFDFGTANAGAELWRVADATAAGAPDGRGALVRLSVGPPPDAILLDLMMPVMSGWQFRARQLALPAFASIPTIVMAAIGNLQRAAITADHFLPKPLRLEELC